jgi:hypothetical protein
MIPGKNPFFGLLLLLLVGGSSGLVADDQAPSTLMPTSSDLYSEVTCTSTNPALCSDVLQLAADTRGQLAPLLQLGKRWRFPVHIRLVTPEDPLAEKVDHESVSVTVLDKTLNINAVLPSCDPDAYVFVQRQFVTALLWEKFFSPTQALDAHTRLDVVPLWLVEGLREWLDDDSEHNREKIVKRAALAKRAPTLADVTDWHELNDDPMVALWQRAFCYYLFESLIRKNEQRENFQRWLASITGPNPSSANQLFPTETGWQRELLSSPARSRDIVYTWDETVAELGSLETIAIPSAKEADTRICTLDTVVSFPRDPKLLTAVQQKVFDLTGLELRAHPSWRPIIALYRFGLSALANDKNPSLDQATKFIVEAQRRRAAEMGDHQKLLDYVNWFEVTKDYAGNTSRFSSYFSTAQKMERIQADPDHPNPIRADLLHIESQL